jgi:hypothetical protein
LNSNETGLKSEAELVANRDTALLLLSHLTSLSHWISFGHGLQQTLVLVNELVAINSRIVGKQEAMQLLLSTLSKFSVQPSADLSTIPRSFHGEV